MNKTVHCRSCDGEFIVPILSASDQLRVAEVARTGRSIEAMNLLRQFAGLELRDAKGVVMHVTRFPNVCHRCNGALPGSGQTECVKCGSLNFDW